MSYVDSRVVSMQFDNARFEQNIAATIQSLDKLRTSLDFANSRRSLEQFNKSAKNFDISSVSQGIEGVSKKFLALTTVGVTALATITQKAVSSGLAFAKSFSFGPVMDGFREFETNMNSIQTILANTSSKGTTLKEVNAALQELNTYSDKTIYNFTQMARNIGTFTAAGIDLKTSTAAIKGIANLAAVSGSSADQASTAMYQLSQALAAGSVKLMDWNSVVNAGMGGEVFQKTLFETGKALGKLKNVPMGETFDQWKKKGNSFRETLKDGWVTSDVLTTALKTFTGDYSEAQIVAMGYSKQQAKELLKMGKVAQDAATKVKTFTQLISTVKETIGSGWTQTFQLIFGNFEEARTMFTNFNNQISNFVNASAKARNTLLKNWKKLGGRNLLIQGVTDSIRNVVGMISNIKWAFKDIFPPMTAKRLYGITKTFADFAKNLKMGAETAKEVRRTFRGFFAVIDIGREILKQLFQMIGRVLQRILPAGKGVLKISASIGDTLTALDKKLVVGGGIHKFFTHLGTVISGVIAFVVDLGKRVISFFTKGIPHDAVSKVFTNLHDRLNQLLGALQKVGQFLKRYMPNIFKSIFHGLGVGLNFLKNIGSNIIHAISSAFQPGEFKTILDGVNVGLLGALVILFKKFAKDGLKGNFSFAFSHFFGIDGGLVKTIQQTFGELTNTLKALQTQLKAKALLKIAEAVAILTASVILLSGIDSKKLSVALGAIAVGFGELAGMMAILDKTIANPKEAAKLQVVGTSLIELAVAMDLLALAIRGLSKLSWQELGKGLSGVAVGLGLMVAAVKVIGDASKGLVRSGAAMIVMATGLWILSKAVKSFSEISWTELGKGLGGVAAGLTAMVAALKLMPDKSVLSGVAIAEVAGAMILLAQAVKQFGNMDLKTIGKGLGAIAVGLTAVVLAMRSMPEKDMVQAATGILILSAALNVMAKAVQSMGLNNLPTLAKGVGALALVLAAVVIAMNKMKGTPRQAAALVIVAGALSILANVVQKLGGMKISDILKGLGALAGVFVVIGVAGKVLGGAIPALMGLGIALALIGGAFALFGVGASLVAKSFELMAKAGKAGAKGFVDAIKVFINAAPEIGAGLALGLVSFANQILKSMPVFIRLLESFLTKLLDTIIRLAPKFGEAFGTLIDVGLKLISEKAPKLIETGFQLLMNLLDGIRKNIGQITTTAIEIMVQFIDSLVAKMPDIVTAAAKLITSFLTELGKHTVELVTAGANFLVSFLNGITQNLGKIVGAVTKLLTTFIGEVAKQISDFIVAFANAFTTLITGMANSIGIISSAIGTFLKALIGEIVKQIVGFATDLINGFADLLKAAGDLMLTISKAVVTFAGKFIDALVTGIIGFADKMIGGFISLIEGTAALINKYKAPLGSALGGLAGALFAAFPDIVWNMVKRLFHLQNTGPLPDVPGLGTKKIKEVFPDSGSPKYSLGESPPGTGGGHGPTPYGVSRVLSKAISMLNSIDYDVNPKITPVVDLTNVKQASSDIDRYMRVGSIFPGTSLDQARFISIMDRQRLSTPGSLSDQPREVKFEQNNYSPKALSTNDIYRNTRSLITLAKEELSIP